MVVDPPLCVCGGGGGLAHVDGAVEVVDGDGRLDPFGTEVVGVVVVDQPRLEGRRARGDSSCVSRQWGGVSREGGRLRDKVPLQHPQPPCVRRGRQFIAAHRAGQRLRQVAR